MGKNTNHIQHIKSSVVVEGKPKLPQSGVLVEGELAINYADGYETISLENTSGEVVTFSSDDYYTEQKLGSGFTGVNSAKTVTEAIEGLDLGNEVEVNSGITPSGQTIELWIDESIEPEMADVYSKSETDDLLDEKLDASAYTPTDLSNYYTKDETSGKTEISNALGAKVNSSTFTAHTADTTIHLTSGDVESQVDNRLGSGFTGANSGNTVTKVIEDNEFAISAALNDLESNKLDASAYTPVDLSDYYTKENIDDKLGDEFIGENSGVTVTSVFQLVDNALLVLNHNINQVSGNTMFVSGNSYGSAVLVGDSGQTASGKYSVAEGAETLASGDYSHAEGYETSATSMYSHAEGYQTIASMYSHAEGHGTKANVPGAHAEGHETMANGPYAHAEGEYSIALNSRAHAEGYQTSATTDASHAEGSKTLTVGGDSAHAEGRETIASGQSAHAEGYQTIANGQAAHAEGYQTSASTSYTHTEGYRTIASNQYEHASGIYNVSNTSQNASGVTLFSVGNGIADNTRHNAFEIRENGDIYIVSGGTDIKLQDHIGGGGSSITVDQVIDSGTSASTNAVSTSAVYGFVTSYTPSITVDQVLDDTTSASTNPVSSKAVYDAVTDNELVWTNAYVTMSGAVSSHTSNTSVHITASDRAKLDSITSSFGTMAYENVSSYSSATEVNTALGNKADKVSAFTDAEYNSTDKKIYFKNSDGTTVDEIDATDFIKDGMVSGAAVSGDNLVIVFNTDAGAEPISIPLSDLFDADAYYDKTAIDDKLGSGFTGANSANTITSVIESNERVTAAALNDLESNKADKVSAFTEAEYNSSDNKIYFKNANGTTVDEIDTSDFGGKEVMIKYSGDPEPSSASTIEIFVDDEAELSVDFYTKAQIDGILEAMVVQTTGSSSASVMSQSAVTSQLSSKLSASEFNTYTGGVNTVMASKLSISDFNTYSGSIDTAMSNLESKVEIATANSSSLTAEVNKYYRFDSAVGTLAITLPIPTDTTHLSSIMFSFTTDSTTNVTFTSTATIMYQGGYSIDADTSYEINAVYNGSYWAIAAITLELPE